MDKLIRFQVEVLVKKYLCEGDLRMNVIILFVICFLRLEDIESWSSRGVLYDVICALNLLDRCSQPVTILEQVKKALKPGGLVLIALVWPFKPYVEMNSDHLPEQLLAIRGSTFEQQVASLMHNIVEPLGFQVVQWSRVPYLCEGDLERTFYLLPDILLALRLKWIWIHFSFILSIIGIRLPISRFSYITIAIESFSVG